MRKVIVLAAGLIVTACARQMGDPGAGMNFFLTSRGSGDGANLGGLAGADRHCLELARAAGSRKREWRAYLSAAAADGAPAVNARDRIGAGPWRNANGVVVAADLSELHGEAPGLTKATSVTELGAVVNGRGDTPNEHDILTGSQVDGTLPPGEGDRTCRNWTSNASDGSAWVGHHDRQGGGARATSWNAAHPSRGCGQANLQATGGAGRFYCFALD